MHTSDDCHKWSKLVNWFFFLFILYFQCWVKSEIEIDIEAGEKNDYSVDRDNGLSSKDFDQRQQTEWTIKHEQGNDSEDKISNEVTLTLFILK